MTAPTHGYDTGKMVNGRKWLIAAEKSGLLLTVLVRANCQEHDGARRLLVDHHFTSPTRGLLFADGGFTGGIFTWADVVVKATAEIARKKDGQKELPPLPKRWNAETCAGVDHPAPPFLPRLRTRPDQLCFLRLLGRDTNHGPPTRPRRPCPVLDSQENR